MNSTMKHTFDHDRIQFMIERDGLEKAIEFSKRTLSQYRKLLRDRNMQRKNITLCCLTLREFLVYNCSYYGSKS